MTLLANQESFDALKKEYSILWDGMTIRPDRLPLIYSDAHRLLTHKLRYEAVSKATQVPWYVIAVLHHRASGLNFSAHLHNGDPLTARTANPPVGRPVHGNPPFTWEESAVDALKMPGRELHTVENWSAERICYELERYSGFDYRRSNRGVKSPYLWSFSNWYSSGRYTKDGAFEGDAVDPLSGAIPLLRQMMSLDTAIHPDRESVVMPAVVELTGLTREEAHLRAEDFQIDATAVEIVQNADGRFTVRGTFPEQETILGKRANSGTSQTTIDEPEARQVASQAGGGSSGDILPDNLSAMPRKATSTTRRTVHLLYATNRTPSFDDTCYSGERTDPPKNSYGAAAVRIPEAHGVGKVELPFKLTLFSLKLFEQALDPRKHFILESVDVLDSEEWSNLVSSSGKQDALVFVHGFNTTFCDALYRAAQVMWDLQYEGIPVLFSWPSRGRVLDYVYDRDSAFDARDSFIEVLRRLRSAGAERINILAHSMGNVVALEALANHPNTNDPLGIAELLMAAPDLDKNNYKRAAAKTRAATTGMTLYASSADRALAASKRLAGNIERAGDVPEEGPVLVEGVDAVDVTFVGEDIFGLGHGTYTNRPVLDDIALLISKGIRPPNKRLSQIRGMPLDELPPRWWRYV